MAPTRIADVIVPEVFNDYVVQRTAELSALGASGIISANPELDRLAMAGGKLINMPYWEDLSGADEVLSDSGALTPANITSAQDVAVLLMRGRAWGANDLAAALSGDDPMGTIGDLVAAYWARREQDTLISILSGVFGATSMAGNVSDIGSNSAGGADAVFSDENFLDAINLLGDADEKLTALAVHSATYNSMRKQDLIDFVQPSEEGTRVPTYMDKRVIVDDGMPTETRSIDTTGDGAGDTDVLVYTTYIFGAGAIGRGNGGAPVPTETDRDSLAGDDYLINRRHFLLHPRGVAFQSASVAASSPTNAELATATNWARVYENKNVRLVKFAHQLS